jgi:1-acyl-sn-glycerol-3-phosphate acyltransferase
VRLPPRWIRRLVFCPVIVLGVGVALISLPIWILVALFISRFVPGNWFLFLYLAIEAAALVALFLLWILSGLGWKLRSGSFRRAHYRLFGWMLRVVVRSAKLTFRLGILLEGPRTTTVGDETRRPALVMSRHAGPGDSMLLMDALVNGYRREPRIVLKEFLQWDPAVDVMLNRLPAAFVPVGRKAGDALIGAIEELAGTMGRDDAFVIFPEGANYTEGRRARAIQKLREIGRPDLAERAEDLRKTLPPRSKGVMTALAAAPPDSDVFFVGHAGLEAFITPGDIWRGMPMDTTVAARIWHVPAEDLPPVDRQEEWLYDVWAEIDGWITANLSETGELVFDDPDAY